MGRWKPQSEEGGKESPQGESHQSQETEGKVGGSSRRYFDGEDLARFTSFHMRSRFRRSPR